MTVSDIGQAFHSLAQVISIGSIVATIVARCCVSNPRFAVSFTQLASIVLAHSALVFPLATVQPVAAQTPSTICVAEASGIVKLTIIFVFLSCCRQPAQAGAVKCVDLLQAQHPVPNTD